MQQRHRENALNAPCAQGTSERSHWGWVKLYRSFLPEFGDLDAWVTKNQAPEPVSPWVDLSPGVGKLFLLLLMLADHKGEVCRSLGSLSLFLSHWDARKKRWCQPAKSNVHRWMSCLVVQSRVQVRAVGERRCYLLKSDMGQNPEVPYRLKTPGSSRGTFVKPAQQGCAKLEPDLQEHKVGPMALKTKDSPAMETQQEDHKKKKPLVASLERQINQIYKAYQQAYENTPLVQFVLPSVQEMSAYLCRSQAPSPTEVIQAIWVSKAHWYRQERMRPSCRLSVLLRHVRRLNEDALLYQAPLPPTGGSEVSAPEEAWPTLDLSLNQRHLEVLRRRIPLPLAAPNDKEVEQGQGGVRPFVPQSEQSIESRSVATKEPRGTSRRGSMMPDRSLFDLEAKQAGWQADLRSSSPYLQEQDTPLSGPNPAGVRGFQSNQGHIPREIG